jgi:hypothetical protein
MRKEFIPYNLALALKELGFDEKSLAYWFNETPLNPEGQCLVYYQKPYDNTKITNGVIREYSWAPLYQQAFRWFREKYNLLGGVYSNASGWAWEIHDNVGGTHRFASEYTGDCLESGMFTSFEKAELACLEKLIEIVKNK